MLFSSDIIIKRNETFLLFLLPTNIDYEQSLIFLLLAVYNKQWSVSCEYNLIKHSYGKEKNTGQPDIIGLAEKMVGGLQKHRLL